MTYSRITIHTASSQKGFTIIETLIAITVLMIAVAGPLSVASKGLLSAQISKDQMIASYLAEESMEAIKNSRDNNIVTNGNAQLFSNGSIVTSCTNTANNYCDMSTTDPTALLTGCASLGNCPLYIDPNGIYMHTSTGNRKSAFSRAYYITTSSGSGACTNTSTECQVHVIVSWNEGSIPNQVELVSEITKTLR